LKLSDIEASTAVKRPENVISEAIERGFKSLVQEVKRNLSDMERHLSAFHEPTGLSVSDSTLDRIASRLRPGSAKTRKWRGEWLTAEGFAEILNIDVERSFDLYELFAVFNSLGISEKRQLKQISWMSPELEERIRDRIELPEWM
jgi:hypothetical protein